MYFYRGRHYTPDYRYIAYLLILHPQTFLVGLWDCKHIGDQAVSVGMIHATELGHLDPRLRKQHLTQ